MCGELALVAARSDSLFRAPPGVFVPFGVMEASAESAGVLADLEAAVDACDAAAKSGDADAVEVAAKAARDVVEAVPFPPDLAARIAAAFAGESSCDRVVVRSSANVEDLAGMSAAGLYESVLGVSATSSAELGAAVREVWASLYSRRAVLARHFAGVPQRDAKMAVLVQEMTPSELSFVLHTRAVSGASENDPAPVPGSPSPTLEAEIAVGLGETLASGARGSPWRLEVEQSSGEVRTTAFASLGTAKVLKKHAPHLGVMTEAVDYSTSDLSKDERKRTALGLRLAAIGAALEAEYGAPQDIEGGVVGDDVFIVQSRPQPL
jgi:phosphoglucan,water dikinase